MELLKATIRNMGAAEIPYMRCCFAITRRARGLCEAAHAQREYRAA